MSISTETERRFKVAIADIPADVATSSTRIVQYYMTATKNGASRVRLLPDDQIAIFTAKGPRVNGSCEEAEVVIPYGVGCDIAETAISKIAKTRYVIPCASDTDLCFELDIFDEPPLPYAIVEIELPSVVTEVVWPDWFGQEITDDNTYSNSALAVPTKPLSFTDKCRALWARMVFSIWSVVS